MESVGTYLHGDVDAMLSDELDLLEQMLQSFLRSIGDEQESGIVRHRHASEAFVFVNCNALFFRTVALELLLTQFV